MTQSYKVSRRTFLIQTAALSSGLVVGFHLPLTAFAEGANSAPSNPNEINAWIVINPDDSIIIRVARSEMGQGSFTGLPMLVAEELACDWNKVRAEYASTSEHLRRNRVFGNMLTGGSRSIRNSQDYLRPAGAVVREMLIAAAAQRWNVEASECAAANSVITHSASNRQITFGAVASEAAKLDPPPKVALKDPKDWILLGQPVKRFDIADKVTGAQQFAIDTQLADMLYAAIAQCPVFGGKLAQADADAVADRRGVVQVVPLDNAVAVVADNWWRAQQALKALPIQWDLGDNAKVSSASIMDFLGQGLDAPEAPVSRQEGDIEQAFAAAHQVIEADYYAPFLEHATMEPQNCTVLIKEGRVDVWAPTQNSEATAAAAAETAGVGLEKVEVHKMHLGGGFGRRGAFQDFVRQAVAIAKALPNRPIKLIWSREEDIQHGFYRPVSRARMRAALDRDGNPTAWHVRQADQSILVNVRPDAIQNGIDPVGARCFSDAPYGFPHQRMEYAMRNTHVPVGFWRAVAHSNNPFFRECFMDEVAHAAGQDPYQLRRTLLADAAKDLAVLDAVAAAAEWGKSRADGVFQGIAVQDSYGSYAATVVEVSVSAAGQLKVHRVIGAIDPGYVVNPDSIKAQTESCVVYALTAALYGEITIKNGRVEQSNFHDYRMLLLSEMPKVETVLAPSGGFWGGVGEPPLAPVAPALCNAIFAATGKRIRSLPLKNHDLRKV